MILDLVSYGCCFTPELEVVTRSGGGVLWFKLSEQGQSTHQGMVEGKNWQRQTGYILL